MKRSSACERFAAAVLWLWPFSAVPAGAELVSSFETGGTGWHLGTIAIGNLDASPALEIVVPYRDASGTWFLDAFKYTGQRLPGFPFRAGGDPVNVSPTLFDLDHDGRDEIIFTCGNRVVVLNGAGSVLWSRTVDATSYVPTCGYQTVTNGFYWYPGRQWLSHLPSTAEFFSEVSPPIVADLNGTGNLEVITGWKILPDPGGTGQDYNPFIFQTFGFGEWGTIAENWSGGVVAFNALTGRPASVYHLHHLVEAGLALGRPAPGVPLHVYVLNDCGGVVAFDKSQPFGLWGKGMLHKQFGKHQQLMSGCYQVPIDVYTADINGDGLDEVLVAGTQLSSQWQPNETILDHDGAILWRQWLPHVEFANNCGWLNSAALLPVNPDHDNHVDVLGWNHSYQLTYRYWNGIELVAHPGWPRNFYPFLPTPPVVGDVDGDGQEEIVLGTYEPSANPSRGGLFVFALDGTLKQSVAVPGGIKQVPALADVEGVGRLDVVYRSMAGHVYVQNFGSTNLNPGLVSWATHRGNWRRDGNSGRFLYPPGTPWVTSKVSGHNCVSFGWTNHSAAQGYRIYRAEQPSGPFRHLVTVPADVTRYTDDGLKPGWQYFYQVGAIYGSNTVHSAPFALLSLLTSNLVANSGFEENDNSHWDKWFTGTIGMTNMAVSTKVAWQGNRSMRILLENQGGNRTIVQFNQYGIPDSTVYVTTGGLYSFGGFLKSTGLSAPSEHWFEWSSTKTGRDTNNRPALPYPFYFTPHLSLETGETDWTYLNRTFRLPAGFPNLELCHRYSVASPASGSIYLDNVFFRQLPAPSNSTWRTFIGFGAAWRYSSNAPPPAWTAPGFDDSKWPLGRAKFGAGSGPTNVQTPLPQLSSSYYFRRQFALPFPGEAIDDLLLSAVCTDVSVSALYPPRLFINGHELGTLIDVVTAQGNEVRYFDLTPFAGLLQPGTNWLAVQLRNTWSDYDDIAFDLQLQAITHRPTSAPHLSALCAGSSSVVLRAETPAATMWQLQSAEAASGPWQRVTVFTNATGRPQSFGEINTSAGDIGFSSAVDSARFYRLLPF